MSGDTPSIPRPPVLCLDCGTSTTNPGMRCDQHRRDKRAKDNKRHNANRTYYHSGAWAQLRAQRIAIDYNCCVLCGNEGPRLAVHHIHARRDGGPDTLDNLMTTCSPCHNSIEAGHPEATALLNEYLAIRPG